jgi:hypothetical protein
MKSRRVKNVALRERQRYIAFVRDEGCGFLRAPNVPRHFAVKPCCFYLRPKS